MFESFSQSKMTSGFWASSVPPDGFVERLASDLDARRRPEPVEHARARGLPRRAAACNQVDVLVASLVARDSDEGHNCYFRF